MSKAVEKKGRVVQTGRVSSLEDVGAPLALSCSIVLTPMFIAVQRKASRLVRDPGTRSLVLNEALASSDPVFVATVAGLVGTISAGSPRLREVG